MRLRFQARSARLPSQVQRFRSRYRQCGAFQRHPISVGPMHAGIQELCHGARFRTPLRHLSTAEPRLLVLCPRHDFRRRRNDQLRQAQVHAAPWRPSPDQGLLKQPSLSRCASWPAMQVRPHPALRQNRLPLPTSLNRPQSQRFRHRSARESATRKLKQADQPLHCP